MQWISVLCICFGSSVVLAVCVLVFRADNHGGSAVTFVALPHFLGSLYCPLTLNAASSSSFDLNRLPLSVRVSADSFFTVFFFLKHYTRHLVSVCHLLATRTIWYKFSLIVFAIILSTTTCVSTFLNLLKFGSLSFAYYLPPYSGNAFKNIIIILVWPAWFSLLFLHCLS